MICVTCKINVCPHCRDEGGSHQSHDVREEANLLDEIKLRMELLMEIYEQMLGECEKL